MAEAAHIGWTEAEFWRRSPTPRQWLRHVRAANERGRATAENFAFVAYHIVTMAGKTLKKDLTFEEFLRPPQADVVETEDGVETAGLKFNPGVSAGVASGIAQLVAVAKKDKSFTDKYGGAFEMEDVAEKTAAAVVRKGGEEISLEEQHAAARAFEAKIRAVRRQKAQAKEEKGDGG